MASAKSGKKVKAVKPAKPGEVFEADVPDPVAVAEFKTEQIDKQQGKYGKQKAKPFKPDDENNDEDDNTKTTWIEIELVGEDDKPIPGEPYEIELPDGSVASGTLDGDGFARVDCFEPGECKICFPNLDEEAWEKA